MTTASTVGEKDAFGIDEANVTFRQKVQKISEFLVIVVKLLTDAVSIPST
jgi:hypothetical protein